MMPNAITYRRTKDQIGRDRARITHLMFKGHSRSKMLDIMEEENGYRLSPQQLRTDIARVRASWLAQADINYEAMVNQELARLDSFEEELWTQLRQSSETGVREIIDQYVKDGMDSDMDSDEMELVVQKISTIRQSNPVNPAYFTHIASVHKERRRLLGLYAPSRVGLVIDQQITVKGYEKVSPDDWPSLPDPDIIEGEVVNG